MLLHIFKTWRILAFNGVAVNNISVDRLGQAFQLLPAGALRDLADAGEKKEKGSV